MPNLSGERRASVKGNWMRAYEAKIALTICEGIAQGRTLNDICLDPERGGVRTGLVHPHTFTKWCQLIPALRDAYVEARRISATAFEEEALEAAREIRAEPESGTKVRAYEVSMGQLRWSASKRDPKNYGQQAGVNVQVPIQINTNLDLAPGAQTLSTDEYPDVFTIEAHVVERDAESDAENRGASDPQASEPPEEAASAPSLELLRGMEVFDPNTQVVIPIRENKKPKSTKKRKRKYEPDPPSERGDWSRRAAKRRERRNGGTDPLRFPRGHATGADSVQPDDADTPGHDARGNATGSHGSTAVD